MIDKTETEEYIDYSVPLAWGCYIIAGGLVVFAIVIMVIVVRLMA